MLDLQRGEGNATVQRGSRVNVKRATCARLFGHDSAPGNNRYSMKVHVCVKRSLAEILPVFRLFFLRYVNPALRYEFVF